MLAFAEWVLNKNRKKKERKDERHNSQIGRESGYVNQQGETAGDDSQEPAKGVFIFAVPEF